MHSQMAISLCWQTSVVSTESTVSHLLGTAASIFISALLFSGPTEGKKILPQHNPSSRAMCSVSDPVNSFKMLLLSSMAVVTAHPTMLFTSTRFYEAEEEQLADGLSEMLLMQSQICW